MLSKTEAASVDQMSTIWAIIEARQKLPALIAVASATEVDDTNMVARGLARVAHEAGFRTGYVYMGSARRSPDADPASYADLSSSGQHLRREGFDSAMARWRASYDVLIVDLPQLRTCALGSHVARLADAVVVALYPARKVAHADRELTALFGQLGASVIGIVKTASPVAPVDVPRSQGRSLTSRFFPLRQP